MKKWFYQLDKSGKVYFERPYDSKIENAPKEIQKEFSEKEDLQKKFKLVQSDLSKKEVYRSFLSVVKQDLSELNSFCN